MTELKGDIERLSREISQAVREAKLLLGELEKASDEYQRTIKTAGAAKKEYDSLRIECEKERGDPRGRAGAARREPGGSRNKGRSRAAGKVRAGETAPHAVPIAPVVHSKCGGCNMSLPMVMLKRIATTDGIVECENCGRILYSNADQP